MKTGIGSVICAVSLLGLAAGCGRSSSSPRGPQPVTAGAVSVVPGADGHGVHASSDGGAGHDHSDWWCAEHGVPETVCGQCDSKLAAAFQKSGDWCKDHDRPSSQCFTCDPQRKVRFSAQYEAKFGKQPPVPKD